MNYHSYIVATNNLWYWKYFNKKNFFEMTLVKIPGRVAQSVTCLATDVSLTADPGVLILAQSHLCRLVMK